MSLGGKGVISVLSNIMPKETHDMTQFCLDNDFKSASELQIKLLDLINNLFIDVNPIPVKEAMNLMGMNAGICRMPLIEMSENNADILKASMKKIGLI
jgi:4-hydroxy-tetrahydrodipicolinate synthase